MNHTTDTQALAHADEQFTRHAIAAAKAVQELEQRLKTPITPQCPPDAAALRFVDDVLAYTPGADDFTLADFAADFAAHSDFLNGLIQPAIEEFSPSLQHAGLTPAETITIKDYTAVSAIPYCADRADAFSFNVCAYINSGTHNAVRHGLMYSTLRTKGHTPDEIASALCAEFMKG